jgi:hypothetical protein
MPGSRKKHYRYLSECHYSCTRTRRPPLAWQARSSKWVARDSILFLGTSCPEAFASIVVLRCDGLFSIARTVQGSAGAIKLPLPGPVVGAWLLPCDAGLYGKPRCSPFRQPVFQAADLEPASPEHRDGFV